MHSDVSTSVSHTLPPDAETATMRFPCGLVMKILAGSEVEARHVYEEVYVENVYFKHGVHVVPGELCIALLSK